MSKPIQLTPEEWVPIMEKIVTEYGKAMVLISWRMRDILGFTVREHKEWIEDGDYGSGYKTTIFLDFWNDDMQTYFRLKYL